MKIILPIFISIWLFVAPWPSGEPHLLEKINWLQTGRPLAMIDWFDIFMHGGIPLIVLGWTLFTFLKNKDTKNEKDET